MRITGGELGGRIIHAPANLPIRPTTDFAKTALFNILSNHFEFENINVADLFAGAGSISYEFISRGAASVTAVDENYNCISFIKKTVSMLKITNLSAIKMDAFKFLLHTEKTFDIIFADPPFAHEKTSLIPDIVHDRKLLNTDGWLIVEHQAKRSLESKTNSFDTRKYGNCAFSFFKF